MIRSPAGFDGADRIKRYLDYYQPSYGVMMLSAGQVAAFSPASLFASGEQGVWYDPSDMTTLFQDAAGTTPVTAVEQPVGLVLDKSKGGVGTNGAKRVNLLNFTEQFDNAAWLKLQLNNFGSGSVANTTATTDPIGTNTADYIQESTANNFHLVTLVTGNQITVAGSTVSYKFSAYVKAAERSKCELVFFYNAGAFPSISAKFDLSAVTATSASSGGATSTGASISSVGNGWYLCTITGYTGSPTLTTHNVQIRILDNSGNSSYTGTGSSGLYIWGADLRLASEASTLPTYQPITADWPSTLAGNHASQSTPTSCPVLSARVNLLTRTEEFDNAVWTRGGLLAFGSGSTVNAAVAPDGTTTADLITQDSLTSSHRVSSQTVAVPSGALVTASVYLKKPNTNSAQYVGFAATDGVAKNYAILVNLDAGTYVNWTGFTLYQAPSSASVTNAGNGWWRVTVSAQLDAGITTAGTGVFFGRSDPTLGISFQGDGTSGVLVWGEDLRVSNAGVNLPVYQRVVTATDYDTTGFPMYLRFDGTDDSMATGTINPGSVDKAQVFAGVRKLSDAARGILVELSATRATNNGAITLDVPGDQSGSSRKYVWATKGTSDVFIETTSTAYNAPVTNILTALGDISGDLATLRANGSQVVQSTSDQGTGNYLSYPLFIGRRGGTTLPFNGQLYSLIVRFSATNLPDATIAQTETWVNGKTGAY